MGNNTIANLITSIRNVDMVEKRTVRVTTTNITKNIGRILLREGFIEDVREHQEGQKSFFYLDFKISEKEEKDIYDYVKAYQQIWFENLFQLSRNSKGSRWNGDRNYFYFPRDFDGSRGSTEKNWRRNIMLCMVINPNSVQKYGFCKISPEKLEQVWFETPFIFIQEC
jgi:hypothetical protein